MIINILIDLRTAAFGGKSEINEMKFWISMAILEGQPNKSPLMHFNDKGAEEHAGNQWKQGRMTESLFLRPFGQVQSD